MHRGTGPFRPQEDPPVRRTALLTHQTEEIVGEVRGHSVIGQQRSGDVVAVEVSIEHIQRRVVLVVLHVLDEVLQTRLDFVSIVVFSTFEVAVFEPTVELGQGPRLR